MANGNGQPLKQSNPNDMSAFKMDDYDEEESAGVGVYSELVIQ